MKTQEVLKRSDADFKFSPSPLGQWLKPVFRSFEKERLILKWIVREEWLNPMGILHGGLSAAIIDESVVMAVDSLKEGHYFTTISNNIEYLSTATNGEEILTETFFTKKGHTFIHADCQIWNSDHSRLIAVGHSVLYRTDRLK